MDLKEKYVNIRKLIDSVQYINTGEPREFGIEYGGFQNVDR